MPLRSKQENDIVHSIGLNHNISDREIENIIRSQFEVIREMIDSGENLEFDNCQMLNFGKFFVSDNKIVKYKERHADKIRRRQEESNDSGTDNSDGIESPIE